MGHGTDVAERAAEGHDPVALLEVVAVAPFGGDHAIDGHLHDGQIALGICADELGFLDLAAIGEGDDHLFSAAGDVVVG